MIECCESSTIESYLQIHMVVATTFDRSDRQELSWIEDEAEEGDYHEGFQRWPAHRHQKDGGWLPCFVSVIFFASFLRAVQKASCEAWDGVALDSSGPTIFSLVSNCFHTIVKRLWKLINMIVWKSFEVSRLSRHPSTLRFWTFDNWKEPFEICMTSS